MMMMVMRLLSAMGIMSLTRFWADADPPTQSGGCIDPSVRPYARLGISRCGRTALLDRIIALNELPGDKDGLKMNDLASLIICGKYLF